VGCSVDREIYLIPSCYIRSGAVAKQAMFGNGGATIDEMSIKFSTPDFIKMDIEGAEAAVLRDAPEILKRGPALTIEVHSEDLERDCLDTLHHKGYRAVIVNPERHYFRNHVDTSITDGWYVKDIIDAVRIIPIATTAVIQKDICFPQTSSCPARISLIQLVTEHALDSPQEIRCLALRRQS
jgi:hypothetical protein